jgi:hypothetical protein
MKISFVFLTFLSFSSTAVLAGQPVPVPEGAIPIENRSEMVREFSGNSNSGETLYDLNHPGRSMRNLSTKPIPQAFVQVEAPTRNSEAPQIKKRSVMANPNAK